MKHRMLCLAIALVLPGSVVAQSEVIVDPAALFEPLGDDWPTYSGDYTGQRHSSLTQIDRQTVSQLTLAWTVEMNYEVRGQGGFNAFGGGASALVGGTALIETMAVTSTPTLQLLIATVASGLIGMVTFTGSVIAYAKLQRLINENAVVFVPQHAINIFVTVLSIAL